MYIPIVSLGKDLSIYVILLIYLFQVTLLLNRYNDRLNEAEQINSDNFNLWVM